MHPRRSTTDKSLQDGEGGELSQRFIWNSLGIMRDRCGTVNRKMLNQVSMNHGWE
jgi:hypothetical protein